MHLTRWTSNFFWHVNDFFPQISHSNKLSCSLIICWFRFDLVVYRREQSSHWNFLSAKWELRCTVRPRAVGNIFPQNLQLPSSSPEIYKENEKLQRVDIEVTSPCIWAYFSCRARCRVSRFLLSNCFEQMSHWKTGFDRWHGRFMCFNNEERWWKPFEQRLQMCSFGRFSGNAQKKFSIEDTIHRQKVWNRKRTYVNNEMRSQ